MLVTPPLSSPAARTVSAEVHCGVKTALAVRVTVVPAISMMPSEGSVKGVQCYCGRQYVHIHIYFVVAGALRTAEAWVEVGRPLNSWALFRPSGARILGDYTDPAAAVGACSPIEGRIDGAR